MKLKDKFIVHEMGDEVMLIGIDQSSNQGFIRGNATTADIIKLLCEDISEDELIDKLLQMYDAPREVIAADVYAVLEKLRAVGALDGESLKKAGAEDSSFEAQLDEHGKIMYHIQGDSMLPLLREGNDVAVIVAKDKNKRCKLWDVVLYKRDSGQYVLHRIIKVLKDGYVICGDNRFNLEKGITDRHIIGVLEGIMRDGVYEPADKAEYLEYIKKRSKLLGIKSIVFRAKGKLFKK